MNGAAVKAGKTTPPKHYTEDTLLQAMETAGVKDMPGNAEKRGPRAKRVYSHLKELKSPNSFDGTRFSDRISPDFMRRASMADMDALRKLIPFKPLTFSAIAGREGMFAMIPKDADRSKPFREPRPSVLAKLKNTSTPTSPKHSAKLREQER